MRRLQIGRQSAGYVGRGHPWIRRDRFTRGLQGLELGEPVQLVDERGRALAAALADPGSSVCARVYNADARVAFDPAAALRAAWERRAALHDDPGTDCYRIVHEEADGLPGLRVERYADVVVLLVRARCIEPHLDAVAAELRRLLPKARLVRREQIEDLRRGEPRTRLLDGGEPDPDEVVVGLELGVAFELRPFDGVATGLYVDQRATRAWLRGRCTGARIANLFAYTGAFSVSLLAAGAAEAVDVDLAAPALAVAEANAARNGVAARHRSWKGDCRTFLDRGDEAFDIIVCDPPTAAQGARGWLARRDYPPLLEACWQRLAPGGLLVATSNTVGKPYPLHETALRVAGDGGEEVEAPPLGEDLPQLRGFPEGRPFRVVALRKI